jgi:outer membrane protein assembly factor BamB
MRGTILPRGGLLVFTATLTAAVLAVGNPASGGGEDVLRPARPPSGARSLAELGERQLERLPWDVLVVRANLSAEEPRAIAGCYLMQRELLALTDSGLLYCLTRTDLQPRWVSSLRAPLVAAPAEGPTHYVFLVKDHEGAYWLHALSKRTGVETSGFPIRLPYAVSSAGVAANGSMAWMGSLGSPGDNKTLASISLITGRRGWGFGTSGMIFAAPVLDPKGDTLVVATDDGIALALPADTEAPDGPLWQLGALGSVYAAPAVTPEHVVIGSGDGLLRCVDLHSGEIKWLQGIDAPIKTSPWVLGGVTRVKRSTGVEGAPEIEVDVYTGIAFARNLNGLCAFDLVLGTPLFRDEGGGRPLAKQGRWVLTVNRERRVTVRDAEDGFRPKGVLDLQMFDLVPTNTTNGAIYGCTSDGMIVAAIPR